VTLCPPCVLLNAAWAVHRLLGDSNTYVLLYGAAYSRYLAIAPAALSSALFLNVEPGC
jgi:hypothetical protein